MIMNVVVNFMQMPSQIQCNWVVQSAQYLNHTRELEERLPRFNVFVKKASALMLPQACVGPIPG
jgi:hypothetical protein